MRKDKKCLQVIILTVLLIGFLCPFKVLCSDRVTVSNIATLIVEKGKVNYTISLKAFVTNHGEAGDVAINLIARDASGFQLANFMLNGTVKKGKTRVFVDIVTMPKEMFEKINEWEAE